MRPLAQEEIKELGRLSQEVKLAQEQLRRVDTELDLYSKLLDAAKREKSHLLKDFAFVQASAVRLSQSLGIKEMSDLRDIDGRPFVRVRQEPLPKVESKDAK
jgi:hypothetical protein